MNKKLKTSLFKSILVLTLLFFLASRLFFFKSGILENIASRLTYPALVLASKITIPLKKHFIYQKNLKDIKKSLEKLKLQNEELIQENIKLKASSNHKQLTSELETFQSRYDLTKGIFTKVLAKTLSSSEHSYLINKGLRDGVKKDMVLIYKFQLVGRISEVFSCHSKVVLLTDKNSKIAAYTNNTQAQGIVLGKNKINRCHLAYVNHLSKVEKDDFVLSSGQGLVFPEGFCLGKVVRHNTKRFCHNIELEPMVDLEKLEFGILLDRSIVINF